MCFIWLFFIVSLINFIPILSNENDEFKIDRRFIFTSYGYKNEGNTGSSSRCCGNLSLTECFGCKYSIDVVYSLKIEEDNKSMSFYKNIINFDKAASEIFEEHSIKILENSKAINFMSLLIYKSHQSDTTYDHTHVLTHFDPMRYYFDGACGMLGIFLFYGTIEVEALDKNIKFNFLYVKIHRIFWKEYRLANMKCCSHVNDHLCSEPCSYKIDIEDSTVTEHKYFRKTPKKYLRSTKLDAYFIVNNTTKIITDDQIRINISTEFMKTEHTIDQFVLKNLNYKQNEDTKVENLMGEFNNVMLDISYGFQCSGYIDGCKIKCEAIPGVEYCSHENGDFKCQNGANDPPFCEKDHRCNNESCSKNGICKIIDNKINCKCQPGYKGKYCQEYYCASQCNGHGYCIGPNMCECHLPFKGESCEEYPCDDESIDPCFNHGLCYVSNDVKKCYCDNKLLSGDFCQNVKCSHKCLFGECFIKNEFETVCVCDSYHMGEKCDIIYTDQEEIHFFKRIFWGITFSILIIEFLLVSILIKVTNL